MKLLLAILSIAACFTASAQQYKFDFIDSVLVNDGGTTINNAWAGGINSAQFSTIELNGDGLPDLFIFDRTDNKILTYINMGTVGSPEYVHTPEYQNIFPSTLRGWCLLRDYNCDGKKDIWGYTPGGIHIYKNTGTPGNVEFTLASNLVETFYDTSLLNLYVSSTDIPSIDDVDGDGDLDVVTFSILGAYLEYHRNLSVETYGTCDSLYFQNRNFCWGHFSESFTTNALQLLDTCDNSNLGVPAEFVEDGFINGDLLRPRGSAGRHTGSTVMTIDEDGDGVKDVLLGDVSYSNMAMLTNGGSAPNMNSSMIAQDTTFPNYDTPIDLKIFPAAFYEDVTNDGIRDLIVGTNTANLSEDDRSVYYYLNIGTDGNPTFSFQQDNLFQDQMIDVGTGSIPTFFDHNADGLMDLLVANFGAYDKTADEYLPSIALYENTGTPTKPAFNLITTDYMGLASSGIAKNMVPAFADLDNDGDEDMIIGDYDGMLHYFVNTAGAGNTANFVLMIPQMTDTDALTIDVGLHAAPTLRDMDGDGDFDLVIGERNGNLNYYANNSTTSPAFSQITDSLGKVRVQYLGTSIGMSIPRFLENSTGETQLFVGGEDGQIVHFNDIDGNLGGVFFEMDDKVSDIHVGLRAAPAIGDLNGDGFPDLVVGNKRGGLQIAMGDDTFTSVKETYKGPEFSLFPNPGDDLINLRFNESGNYQIQLLDVSGKLIYNQSLNGNRVQFDVSSVASGYYLIRVSSESGSSSKPVIVR